MSTLFAKEYQCFEDIKRTRPDGTEYWAARELAPVLDYARWENFYKVIKRAMIACENSGRSVSDDFPEVGKIVEIGATRKMIADNEWSRYTLNKAAMQSIVHACPPPSANHQDIFAAWRQARARETQRRAAQPKKISFDRRKFAPYLERLGSDKEIEELFLEFLRQRVN